MLESNFRKNPQKNIQDLKRQISEFLLDENGYIIALELESLSSEDGLLKDALVDFLKTEN